MLADSFGRRIDYLRLSVTDRCNLRCAYCLPASFAGFAPADELLSDDEILRLVESFAGLGFSKLRVTGGEPLVRAGLPDLIGRLSKVERVSEISLSTNGVLLAGSASRLARAGLRRVNVSLDSLRPDRFRRITRFGKLSDVFAGIKAALAAGLSPVKLNVVVARGFNDDELADFAALTQDLPLHVRFIELMPMGDAGFFSPERRVALPEMMSRLPALEPLSEGDKPAGHGPARYFRRPGAAGTIGFISALSCAFCASCNRVRLTSRGVLVPCLDGSEGEDLRALLRGGAAPERLRLAIARAVLRKPERHALLEKARDASPNPRRMCQVGG